MNWDERQFYRAVGTALQEARRKAKITQIEMAKSLKTSRTTITNMEAGRQGISLHQAALIAEILPEWSKVVVKGIPPKHPVTAISFLVLFFVAFFLGALLTYVFTVSTIMGFVILAIYAVLGIFGYRLAHVQTKQAGQNGESDELD